MGTYCLSMDCLHATLPDQLWHVRVYDIAGRNGLTETHGLWVPQPDTWTLDTLRMVLHELASYVPADDAAMYTVKARAVRRRGRPRADGAPRLPVFNDEVILSVTARGWSAEVWTHRNEYVAKEKEEPAVDPRSFSEPMQAVLLDLAARSPLPLSTVSVVDCGDRYQFDELDTPIKPSRRDVVRGIEYPDGKVPEYVSRNKRIKRLIKDILDE